MRGLRPIYAVFLASALFSDPFLAPAASVVKPSRNLHPATASAQNNGANMRAREKALHGLNRLAFGPRPGEVEAVAAMGVERWIDLQLHPENIDDSALQQRLAAYEAPFLSPQSLMLRFPPRNLIRQALDNRIAVPGEEPQQAVWQSQMALVEQRQQRKLASQTGEEATQSPNAQTNRSQGKFSALEAGSLLQLPPQQRYEKLLHLEPGRMQDVVRSLAAAQRPAVIAGMSPAQRETVVALLNPRMVVVNEAQSVRLLKDIYSTRQLQRVMTEFWLNHFNVYAGKNEVEPYYLSQFEQEVIAPHALGNFEELLVAVAESPAMLIYLDNRESVGPNSLFAQRREAASGAPPRPNRPQTGINENYGRELMELHTVGVSGGYTQKDVIEAAKALTGWVVAPPQQGGGFRFEKNRHEPGDKMVMGHTIKEGGQEEGLELLHQLATSPATAHFLSKQLAVRFVSDHPSQMLVDRMSKTFLKSHGNIAAVLQTMVRSPEFWSAPDRGNKIKTPLDFVTSAVRATNANIAQPYRLVSELRTMGMPLDGAPQPNGFAMTNDAWTSSSALVNRMNFALALASNRIPGVTVPISQLTGQSEPLNQQEHRLEEAILHADASARLRTAVLQSLDATQAQTHAAATLVLAGANGEDPFAEGLKRADAQPSDAQQVVIAGLLLGSPQFQQR